MTFPLILPAIGASLLLTFTASFDEFLFALFLGGSDVTLPVYMWTQVRFPQTLPSVLALGALIFMVTVVLVIAADDSIKPQTREHRDILELLKLEHGVIALTKTDLVEPEWLELVEEEVRDLTAGTFLAEAPIIRTSSGTRLPA